VFSHEPAGLALSSREQAVEKQPKRLPKLLSRKQRRKQVLERRKLSLPIDFLDALLWMARSGGRWRDLSGRFGGYQSVKRRYYRWIEMGVLDRILAALAREADLEWLMIDTTIVRAHQHAAGARKVKGGRMPRALAARAAD
jgi:transposase